MIIRIFNGFEVQIENSVTNSYSSDGIFNSHRATIMDCFSFILFLQHLYSCLNWCYFIKIYAQITTFFDQEMFCSVPILRHWRRNVWRKTKSTWRQDVKNDVKIIILTSCTRIVLHPLCKSLPSPGRVHRNSGWVCKKTVFLTSNLIYDQNHRNFL